VKHCSEYLNIGIYQREIISKKNNNQSLKNEESYGNTKTLFIATCWLMAGADKTNAAQPVAGTACDACTAGRQ
jgi:hypothetical protein